MNFLTHALTFLIGFFSLIILVAGLMIMQPEEFATNHEQHGKVIAYTQNYNLHACGFEKGFTVVELMISKKLVMLCGFHKQPGEKIKVTLDGPSEFHI